MTKSPLISSCQCICLCSQQPTEQNADVGPWLCSLGYFRFYVVFAFVILFIASAIGIVYPIWEARDLIAKFLTGNTFQELIEKSFHGSSRGGSR